MIGRTLGEYRIQESLGQGGMGTVYRAVDQMLERDVALKLLRSEVSDEPALVERFRTEAVILARLNHPNIATLYRLAREGDRFFMVMEFVRGRTLAALLAQTHRLPLAHALSWCCQVLDAIEYAHELGVVHRDLKPANLMITDNGTVKVTDFGIARVLGTSRQTRLGYVIGTPAYMSPEQVRGREVDGRSDIYALGMVLYEVTTGRLPFKAVNEFSLLSAQVAERAANPRTFAPDLPPEVDAAIARAIAKAPEERFQTAGEFRTELDRALDRLAPWQTEAGAAGLPPPRQRATTSPQVAHPAAPPTPPPIPKETRLAAGSPPPKETRLATEPGPGVPPPAAPAAVPERPVESPGRPGPRAALTWKHAAAGAAVVVTVVAFAVATVLLRRAPTPSGDGRGGMPSASQQTPQTTTSPGSDATSPGRPRAAGTAPAEPPSQRPEPPALQPEPRAGLPEEPRRRLPVVREPGTPKPPVTVPPAAPPAATPPPSEAVVEPPAARTAEPATAAPTTRPRPSPTPVTFEDIKFLYVEGDRTREIDAVLVFDADSLRVLVERSRAVYKVMPYQAIASAVFSQSKRPPWKETTGGSPLVGILAAPVSFLKSTQHWLTVQSRDDFVMLRLDKRNYQTVIPTLESRAGVKVEITKGEK